MAKVQIVSKSRKELKCGKCGNTIPVGSKYYFATPRYRAKIVRCDKCKLRHWETSSSDYILSIGALVEDWEKDYGVYENVIDDITSILEEQKDNAESSLENMPEQLQEGETGQLLQERIDSLESAIESLEEINNEDFKDEALGEFMQVSVDKKAFLDYYKEKDVDIDIEDYDEDEDNEKNILIDLSELPDGDGYDEICELTYLDEDTKDEVERTYEEKFAEAINDILSELEY